MLKILGSKRQLCDGVSRREMLQIGGAGLMGLELADLLASNSAAAPVTAGSAADIGGTFGKAKHCIILFLYGSPSQLDTFDPKPNAPNDIRGPFQSIPTSLPGVRISEHLPGIARLLDKTTLVRSLTHPHPIHGVAYALTGIDRVDIPMELNRRDTRHWPNIGSVLEYLDERKHPHASQPAIPNNVHLPWELSSRSFPHKRAGTVGGFLGSAYDPVVFEFSGKATSKTSYRPHDPYCGIEPDCRFSISKNRQDVVAIDRLKTRRRLLQQFDDQRRHLGDTSTGRSLSRFQKMAFSVLSSPQIHTALDLKKEPATVRERYGHHLFGQSALLARRMVEAGTRLVTVFWDEFGQSCGSWDTHEKAEKRLKNELCPGLDQAYTALLEDLEQRGLLDETVVICMGEHGRTPKPEKRNGLADGRGHWSRAYSGLFAGCGIARGNVIGASDEQAAWVRERPVSPKDILKTAYHLLGVNAEHMIPDRLGRPVPIVSGGEVVREMLSAGEEVTLFALGGEGVLRTHGRTAEAVAVIHRALDCGVNYCDTSPAYAGSIDYYGAALGERRREIFLASKTHDRTRDGSLRLLEDSLRRLRTDHLDLWQLHDLRTMNDLDRIFHKGGAIEALTQARDEGRVRFLGITGHHDPAILLEAMRRFEFDTLLVALNMADVHRLSFVRDVLPEAERQQLGVIGMKVYGAGTLLDSGEIAPEQAMRYVLSLRGVSTVVIGCGTPAEVEENARIAQGFAPLTSIEMQNLEAITQHNARQFTSYKAG
eukprot:g10467.t1